ncbi:MULTISPECIES: FAD-binding oxidoreductase [unclassified Streptomyces]|uniref:FAD-binding oxidoreductase n=1 Tax=unclassified Streptomyces TaxID=2593676 RepID=UPI001F04E7FB|nr:MULTISPECIES: FAD-binding oxidoreductase [unclassified Streptomyces]MCH0564156.1 FAD-binding oxidoreductase [Streptomyces sp. MUM 2J]MCH0568459.1 FAD-binding oxidoreductase [Streptomyces sp. MUM 136J]
MSEEREGWSRRSALKGLTAAAGAVSLSGVSLPSAVSMPLTRNGTVPHGSHEATELTGRLVRPQDPGYESARKYWDELFNSYPQVVVFCQNTEDVVNALRYARENDIAFRARSGRHSLEGWSSVDGGITIDVSDLKSVHIDPRAMTATVGTGLTQGELVNNLSPFGFPTGNEATVGLGGLILGGGIGLFSRKMGVACDNLLATEIVIPDGASGAKVVRADSEHHSDLLWACRGGGGGNFGIATSYQLRIHAIPRKVGIWKVTWPFRALERALDTWQRWAPSADERLSSTYNAGIPSVGIEVSGTFLGPADQVRKMVEPLLEVPGASFEVTAESYVDYFNAENSGPREYFNYKFTPMWVHEPLPRKSLGEIRHMLANAPSEHCNFWALSWGGAVRRPPSGGAAWYWRDPIFYAEPGTGWNGSENNSLHIGWIEQFRDILRPYFHGGYVNVPDRSIANWGEEYYGEHFKRLRAIKGKYDPHEVFQFEQSIPPLC